MKSSVCSVGMFFQVVWIKVFECFVVSSSHSLAHGGRKKMKEMFQLLRLFCLHFRYFFPFVTQHPVSDLYENEKVRVVIQNTLFKLLRLVLQVEGQEESVNKKGNMDGPISFQSQCA